MSVYKGLYTFDSDNHRYIPVGRVDGIIDCYKPEEPKEPLIKDEFKQVETRKFFNKLDIDLVRFDKSRNAFYSTALGYSHKLYIEFNTCFGIEFLEDGHIYSIEALCGEEE